MLNDLNSTGSVMSVSEQIRRLELNLRQVQNPSSAQSSVSLPNNCSASPQAISPTQNGQRVDAFEVMSEEVPLSAKKQRPPRPFKPSSVTQKLAADTRIKGTSGPSADVDEQKPIILIDNELEEHAGFQDNIIANPQLRGPRPSKTNNEISASPRDARNALQGFKQQAGRVVRSLSDNAQSALSKRASRLPESDKDVGPGTNSPQVHDHAERQIDHLPSFAQQANQLTRKLSDSAQGIIVKRPLKPTKPQELGLKLSQTFDPLFRDAKVGGEKAIEGTRPLREQASQGIAQATASTKEALNSMGVSTVFLATQQDIADVVAKMKGKEGVCSKCQGLPMEKFMNTDGQMQQASVEWATPLARLLFHADWCRVCRLLLDGLCEPENDPLQNEAVAPYVQPEIKGLCMREWISKGWKFADKYWPFGHGAERHEGATHVLGQGREALERVIVHSFRFAVAWGLYSKYRPQDDGRRRFVKASRAVTKPQRCNEGSQSRHPLSCVVKISTLSDLIDFKPGLVFLSLLGYGRKAGADIQVLSNFRLQAVSATKLITNEGLAYRPSEIGNSFSYGAVLDPAWIDPTVSRQWLAECEAFHGSECNTHGWAIAMQKPSFLRVIDVHDLCVKISPDPAGCRFVALSYVWGGASMIKLQYENMGELMKPNALLRRASDIPKTIIDAIEVVKEMGEQFLWVDALCILQGDALEAAKNIACMDRVYGNAVATIVAGQGESAYTGLGGILPKQFLDASPASPRHLYQKSAEVKNSLALVAPLATTCHGLDTSAWNARAWTFQERLLSRRLIIFTHGQVIWHCRKMICREDMNVEDSGVPYKALEWLSLKPRHLGVDTGSQWRDGTLETTRHGEVRVVRSATFGEYVKMVTQYTYREMSYQSDVLNAFAGLLHIFSLCFKCSILFGLPECLLDVALLWRPTSPLQRRAGFPSWSWAGWVGSVSYDDPFKIERSPDGGFRSFCKDPRGEEGIRPLIRWHKIGKYQNAVPLNGDGVGIPLDDEMLPNGWENGPFCVDDRGHGGSIRAPSIKIDKNMRTQNVPSHCLVFWTGSTDKLYLGQPISQQSDENSSPTTPLRRYRIRDSDNYIVGNVLFDSAHNEWMNNGRHEFLQIAEAHYLGLDDEERDVEDCPLYVLMLVEWDEAFQVAYRRGLGRVQKSAWMLAQPRLKLVYLA